MRRGHLLAPIDATCQPPPGTSFWGCVEPGRTTERAVCHCSSPARQPRTSRCAPRPHGRASRVTTPPRPCPPTPLQPRPPRPPRTPPPPPPTLLEFGTARRPSLCAEVPSPVPPRPTAIPLPPVPLEFSCRPVLRPLRRGWMFNLSSSLSLPPPPPSLPVALEFSAAPRPHLCVNNVGNNGSYETRPSTCLFRCEEVKREWGRRGAGGRPRARRQPWQVPQPTLPRLDGVSCLDALGEAGIAGTCGSRSVAHPCASALTSKPQLLPAMLQPSSF